VLVPSRGGRTDPVAIAVFGAVFGAVLVRQLVGRGPGVWVIFLVGALVTLLAGVLSPTGAGGVLFDSLPILLFLLALFVFAQALQRAGALDHLARWLVGRARRPADLPFVLFVGIGLVSALFVNDALVLVAVPLLIAVAQRLRADPKPLLLVMAFAVTVGSALTPFGNPQNLLVAIAAGFASPVTVFLEYLALPTAINLVVGGWFLARFYRRSMPPDDAHFARMRSEAPPLLPRGGWWPRVREHPVLWAFPATMAVLVGLDVVSSVTRGPSLPIWEPAIAGAAAVLVLSPSRGPIARQLEWRVLLLFVGLFVVVQGAVVGGVVAEIEALLPIPGPGHPTAILAIVGASLAGSQAVSNVPWVGLQIPVLSGLGYSAAAPVGWMALAAGSTLAGNVTLIGAASNLIMTETAERRGVSIRLGEFVRAGLPLTAITVGVLVACLWLRL
jgi:Na+/H+ antiporter NhaD/arsenite permease-like protein